MSYDVYVFDLDGTLLDTLRDLTASVNHALRWAEMPERTIEEVRWFVGNGVKKLMERAVPEGTDNPRFTEVYQEFRDHYLHHGLDTTEPYPGIMEMLRALKDEGKQIAVVSNVAIGEREDIRKKPAPDTVEEALRRLKADCTHAVYVGDSDVDIQTAMNSGLPCISVLWGFRDKDFLLAHGATTFVASPHELLAI